MRSDSLDTFPASSNRSRPASVNALSALAIDSNCNTSSLSNQLSHFTNPSRSYAITCSGDSTAGGILILCDQLGEDAAMMGLLPPADAVAAAEGFRARARRPTTGI